MVVGRSKKKSNRTKVPDHRLIIGVKSGSFRERLNVISGSNRGHFGSVCMSFQVQIGALRDQTGVISGSYRGYFEVKSGSFTDHF